MDTVSALVRSLFQKESLADCSLEELQAMARQYSYFTPVQFLLAEKLRTTDEDLYNEQLQKLSLHFNNPLWLDYLLNSNKTEQLFADASAEIQNEDEPREEDNPTALTMVNQEQGTAEAIISELEKNPFSESAEPIRDESFGPIEQDGNIEQLTDDENDSEADLTDAKSFPGQNNEASISIPPLPDLNEKPAETELSFQPYHTVDYFASQGIKFVPEEKPVDRFGKQLKSFTEWLKSMKKLPQSEASKIADPVAEKNVEQMAQHSIDEGEVVTETMAEVWIKQGNKEKAIETYNKLSLLNPDKSAYFASLAEQIKNS